MGVSKTVIKEGTGETPVKGQTVTIEYTGWLKDESKPNNKGWDDGVTQMRVGEKATLDISADSGYGARDVELKKVA
ncbi:hypothetical protein UVI_02000570 [Ustilaginoidea virens]|uniref:peptidylprolyl isomerase n=1 Tax=Ustilaginoidea virens TaxID=1159556 RepID=A0A1B5L204_USTVR|nr:hypothetical protein UVI_02000570 [Ustilaginoidea virens]